ncbi:TspO/MBR family protein [Paraliobacillus sediminis]|uniref:TspO/MBR family protein n=1 Tax=Paraliobacillus sediminis TaxID=1885916 RepID=UPI000E3DCF08|nr:TspO/MBR family protein [Paraliobacillus sediminis]
MLRFFINLFALVFVIAINYLSNALPFNGQTTAEISNRLNVLFTPAGYVFSIWGVIYLLLAIWVFRQLPKGRRDLPVYIKGTPLFILSCFLNSVWLFLWHYEYFNLSVIIMLAFLINLIVLYTRVKAVATSFSDLLPFSVYLGWVSVATIANVSYVLVENGWNGFELSDSFWTIAMLIIATLLAVLFRLKEKDIAYPLVFVWAFIGIGIRNSSEYSLVAYTAFFFAAVVFLIALFGRQKHLPTRLRK